MGKGCRNPPILLTVAIDATSQRPQQMARWPRLFRESFSMAGPKDLACFKCDLLRSFSMLSNIQSMLHRHHFNPLKTLGSRSYYFSVLESGGGGLEESHSFPRDGRMLKHILRWTWMAQPIGSCPLGQLICSSAEEQSSWVESDSSWIPAAFLPPQLTRIFSEPSLSPWTVAKGSNCS